MARSVDIDDEVYEHLKSLAEPFVDSPNSVLRRVLGLQPDDAADGSSGTFGAQGRAEPARSTKPRARVPKPRARMPRTRAPKGVLLPETAYQTPILEALVEHGGRAPTSEVLATLEPRIKDQLMPADFEPLGGSGLIRWKNRAQFARLQLVRSGDMKKGSPRGMWEISDAGRARVEGIQG